MMNSHASRSSHDLLPCIVDPQISVSIRIVFIYRFAVKSHSVCLSFWVFVTSLVPFDFFPECIKLCLVVVDIIGYRILDHFSLGWLIRKRKKAWLISWYDLLLLLSCYWLCDYSAFIRVLCCC